MVPVIDEQIIAPAFSQGPVRTPQVKRALIVPRFIADPLHSTVVLDDRLIVLGSSEATCNPQYAACVIYCGFVSDRGGIPPSQYSSAAVSMGNSPTSDGLRPWNRLLPRNLACGSGSLFPRVLPR